MCKPSLIMECLLIISQVVFLSLNKSWRIDCFALVHGRLSVYSDVVTSCKINQIQDSEKLIVAQISSTWQSDEEQICVVY